VVLVVTGTYPVSTELQRIMAAAVAVVLLV
jgi:hypothetical protein